MKKSLMLAAATLALSVTGAASALNVNAVRVLVIDGFPGWYDTLGVATFTALGRSGPFCDYLMNWESPFNPNDVALCIVREVRTPVTPSCIINENVDITSTLLGGPAGDTYCEGFNLKGEPFCDVSLILGESPLLGLRGVAIFPTGIGQVYPIAALC